MTKDKKAVASGIPFVFGVAVSGEHFTDREEETERLVMNFQHGVNTIVISPRRWGKTSLVRKAASLAESESLKIVYLDIFTYRSPAEFYDAFATAVIKQTATKFQDWMENAKMFLSRISPGVSFGTDPMSEFKVFLNLQGKEPDPAQALDLPEKIAKEKGIRIVVCIDEFQQIGEFAHSLAFQKRLRGIWQLQTHVSYCLFGSKQHMMSEMFGSRSHPFYKFGDAMYLQPIPVEYWQEYIVGRFKETGKEISAELSAEICALVQNNSSYVQHLAWLVWLRTDKTADHESLEKGFNDLLDQNSALFEKQTENLSAYQMNYLLALANGETSLSSKEKIDKYQLGSSSTVNVIKKALLKQDLIVTERRQARLADPLMGAWLRKARRQSIE